MKNSIRNPFLFVWFILLLGVATMVAIPRVSLADETQPFVPESEMADQ